MTQADEIALVRRVLPRLLKEDPAFMGEVIALLSSHLTTREETAKILDEIRALREESLRRFEASEKRFEAIDRRFEAVDHRFEAVDKRFEAIIREMKQMREEMATKSDIAALKTHIDRLGSRWGLVAEDTFRSAMEDIMVKEFGGKVEKWRHEGCEIDLVVSDGRTILVEVKSSLSVDRLKRFLETCEVYEKVTGTRPSRRVVVTMFLPMKALELAQQKGVEILSKSGDE